MMRLTSFRISSLGLIILSLTLVAAVWAATDDFERADGPLGSSWAAHADMVILNGNLHNQSSTTGWDSFIAVYNVSNPNEAIINGLRTATAWMRRAPSWAASRSSIPSRTPLTGI